MKFTSLPIDQVTMLQNNQLYIEEIFQDKNSLMRSLSQQLFSTQQYYQNLQELCINFLKLIIQENQTENLSLQLFELTQCVQLLSDYFEQPTGSSQDQYNLELLSMLFQSKVCVYSFSYEKILKKRLLFNRNQHGQINLFQHNNQYYSLQTDANYKNQRTITPLADYIMKTAIDADYNLQELIKNQNNKGSDSSNFKYTQKKQIQDKTKPRSYSSNDLSVKQAGKNSKKKTHQVFNIHTPEYYLNKPRKVWKQQSSHFKKSPLPKQVLKKENSVRKQFVSFKDDQSPNKSPMSVTTANSGYSNSQQQVFNYSPQNLANSNASNSPNYFVKGGLSASKKNMNTSYASYDKPPGINLQGSISKIRSKQSSFASNLHSPTSPSSFQKSQFAAANNSEDYVLDDESMKQSVAYSPKSPSSQVSEFDYSSQLSASSRNKAISLSYKKERGTHLQQHPVILDDAEGVFKGKLKFYDENGKYGFIIKDNDCTELFVHLDDLALTGINIENLKNMKNQPPYLLEFTQMSYIGKYNKSKKAVNLKWLNQDEHSKEAIVDEANNKNNLATASNNNNEVQVAN